MSLRQAASEGGRWTAFSVVAVALIQLAGLVVLARILSPVEFGLIAMMMVFIGLADTFSQFGISTAIIQQPSAPSVTQLSTLFWISAALGVCAYLLVLIALPAVVWFFGEPRLAHLMPIMALSFLISPLGAQFGALLRRALRFRPLALIEVGKGLVGTVTAIGGALAGWGVWALVAGYLASVGVGALLLLVIAVRESWLPRFRWSLPDVYPLLSFGGFFSASNLVNYVNSRSDQLLVGVLLGPRELGFYVMAFKLVIQPVMKINSVVTQVAFPILARIGEDRSQMQRWYLKMLNLLTTVNAPVLLGMAAVAPLAVPLLLGQQWLPAVPLVQVLSLYALLRSAGNAGGTLIFAAGEAKRAFVWNAGLLLVIPGSVALGAALGGLIGVAWTLTAMQAALFLLWYPYATRRIVGQCFGRYLRAFMLPTLLAAAMAVAVGAFAPHLPGWPPIPVLIMLVALGAVLYVCAYFFLFRAAFIDYLALLTGRTR